MASAPLLAAPLLVLDHDVPVPLADGVETRADVWRPADGRPVPAILIRTPYDKSGLGAQSPIDGRRAVRRGYALVIQDVRGKGTSGGTFEPFVQERGDGRDSVEWVAAQPWCDGRVVMIGASYVGATQWLAASARPAGLKAIAPLISTDGYGEGWSFRSGVRELGFLGTWIAGTLAPLDQLWPDDLERSYSDIVGLAAIAPWSADWYAEPADSPYWQARSVTAERADLDVPVLHVAGWYDCFLAGTLRSFAHERRAGDRLIVGPWDHDAWYGSVVGERNLGSAGAGDSFGLGDRVLDFYDDTLAGRPPALPPVSAFLLGARSWEALPTWPPPGTRTLVKELDAGSFDVDPSDLPPALGGRALLVGLAGGKGARDQQALVEREDVVVTHIGDVRAGTVIAGPVRACLRVSAEGGQTRDWVATLCIVHADDTVVNLAEGIARVPTGDDEVVIEIGDVFVEVGVHEALAVIVAGGSFPRWEPPADAGRQRVLDGSTIELPVLG